MDGPVPLFGNPSPLSPVEQEVYDAAYAQAKREGLSDFKAKQRAIARIFRRRTIVGNLRNE